MKRFLILVLLSWIIPVFATPADIEQSASTIKPTTFDELLQLVKPNSFGPIKLDDLDEALQSGSTILYQRSGQNSRYTISIKVNAAPNEAVLTFYMPDSGYQKMGTSYAKALQKLAIRANGIAATSVPPAASDDSIPDDSGAAWSWTSGRFKCQLLINDGAVQGGDFFYECRI